MPIKGTVKSDIENPWQVLSSSEKDQAELFMIIDLLTNDLRKIDSGEVKVLAKKKRLIVFRACSSVFFNRKKYCKCELKENSRWNVSRR